MTKDRERPSEIARAPSVQDLTFHYYELMAAYETQPYLESKSVWIILRNGESHSAPRQISYWRRFIHDAHIEFVPGAHLELSKNIGEISSIIKTALKVS